MKDLFHTEARARKQGNEGHSLTKQIDFILCIMVAVMTSFLRLHLQTNLEAHTVTRRTMKMSRASMKSDMKIGPRMTLKLVNIEEGLCS